ncbi:hypothetical protein LZ31DRAFT_160136 [Colletotrichum somersetense]|nr:hypothetical protein LZ31DRAFT_160136 [Colletotrichum somersetense]
MLLIHSFIRRWGPPCELPLYRRGFETHQTSHISQPVFEAAGLTKRLLDDIIRETTARVSIQHAALPYRAARYAHRV